MSKKGYKDALDDFDFQAPKQEKKGAEIKTISAPKLKVSKPTLKPKASKLQAKEAEERPLFDLNPFVPDGMKIDIYESYGEFMIPHRIFEFIHKAIKTKVELLVFTCLVRNTLGYRISSCQISQTFIANWTGIAAPNVRKGLRKLEKAGFAKLVSSGTIDHERSVYEIPLVKAYLKFQRELEGHGDQNDLSSEKSKNRDQNNLTTQIESISNKEIEKKEKETLSQVLKNYLDGCTPAKRESEYFLYQQNLQGRYTEELISDCVALLLKTGIPGTGEVCHSPIAFLCKAMPQVIALVDGEKKKKLNQVKVSMEAQRRVLEEQKLDDEDDAHFFQAKNEFDEFFAEENARNLYLTERVAKKRAQFPVPADIAERFVILEWFESKQSSLTNKEKLCRSKN